MRYVHTGWPKSKSGISNGCSSKTMNMWPHVDKAKIDLRSGSFFPVSADFFSIQDKKMKIGTFIHQTPRSNGQDSGLSCWRSPVQIHQGHKNFYTFAETLHYFTFFQNLIFNTKNSASQTNFGFSNMGSDMHSFRATAIWNTRFWFGSPCTKDWFIKNGNSSKIGPW